VLTESSGQVQIEVPRDRAGTFELSRSFVRRALHLDPVPSAPQTGSYQETARTNNARPP
jgi:transposase-like protein